MGLELEWCCIFRINNDESWLRGTAGSWRRTRVDGCAPGGADVWLCGCIDDSLGNYVYLCHEDGSVVGQR